jgi:hypothetical protein
MFSLTYELSVILLFLLPYICVYCFVRIIFLCLYLLMPFLLLGIRSRFVLVCQVCLL